MQHKDKKKGLSQFSFILSALAGAVGLGNIWGFPTEMYANGGAAFLIPFFIAILICGLPILILEINIGNKWRKSHIKIFDEFAGRSGRFFGWLQSTVVWIMSSFYAILVAWTLASLIMSFVPSWLNEKDFFTNKILGMDKNEVTSFSDLGNISWYILLAYLVVWIVVIGIVSMGVVNGIAKANKIFVPGLFVMLIFIAIYSITLPGAGDGLQKLFEPKLSKLADIKTWTSAFRTGFFTLSICTAAIIIFSSYAPKDQDNTNQAFIIIAGDSLVGILAAITVFAGIGNVAATQNLEFDKVFGAGDKSLVFSVFPEIFARINNFSFGLGNFIAIIFFLTIFFAGISSLIMGLEAATSPIHIDLKIKRWKAIILVATTSALAGSILVFQNSTLLIDGIATWVAGLWQLLIGLIEIIGTCFIWKKANIICENNNKNSWIKLKKGFKITIYILTPAVLIFSIIMAFYVFINNSISNAFVFATIGLSIGVILVILVALILTFIDEIKNFLKKGVIK